MFNKTHFSSTLEGCFYGVLFALLAFFKLNIDLVLADIDCLMKLLTKSQKEIVICGVYGGCVFYLISFFSKPKSNEDMRKCPQKVFYESCCLLADSSPKKIIIEFLKFYSASLMLSSLISGPFFMLSKRIPGKKDFLFFLFLFSISLFFLILKYLTRKRVLRDIKHFKSFKVFQRYDDCTNFSHKFGAIKKRKP